MLHTPAQRDLTLCGPMLLGDAHHILISEQWGHRPRRRLSDGRVGCDENPVLLAVLAETQLREARVQLHLIDRGDDIRGLEE